MSEPYEIIVGLEVHVQLLTRTKLFCGCSVEFGQPPNSATCPVCLGLQGTLPVMNRKAFELAVKAALALNCTIAPTTKWDRKNYFYPDLPKNYQISQYDLPFSTNGYLHVQTAQGERKIRIIRVHLEEDAGKMLHDELKQGKDSLVDLNRTGTPLLEIVSQPDIRSPEEAKAYLEEIRLIMRDLEISDCEMQEGSLRCDANINLHIPQPNGTIAATPIVEIKNLNSFRAVERALKYEATRQYTEFQRTGVTIDQGQKATAGWDDARGITIMQRHKEEVSDYRYFPEPDLVPVTVNARWVEEIQASLGDLPHAARAKLRDQFGLSEYDAKVITGQGRAFRMYFEEAAQTCANAKEACNWLTNDVLAAIKDRKIGIAEFPLTAKQLGQMICLVQSMGLNKARARDVYLRMLETGNDASTIVQELGLKVVDDEEHLRDLVRQAIAANAKAVSDYKNGKVKAADAIKGFVMRQTRGMAKMDLVERLMVEELAQS